jgi:hypothetical protein
MPTRGRLAECFRGNLCTAYLYVSRTAATFDMVPRLGSAGEVIHTIVLCALTLGRSAHPAKTAILYDSGAISDAYVISIAGITLITADFGLSVRADAVDDVHWTGVYVATDNANVLPATDDFTIHIYADAGGVRCCRHCTPSPSGTP